MTSIYDVLKASKGIHVDDTFAELWGRKLSNAYTVETYIGTLPATLQTVEGYLKGYKIYGNTEQDGTPTPDNPIEPQGCGERTGNLFDKDATLDGYWLSSTTGNAVSQAGYSVSDYIRASDGESYTLVEAGRTFCWYDENKSFISTTARTTASAPTGAAYFRVNLYTANKRIAMVIEGSTALPYEPYGYKLSLTVNGVEYPIYLGESQTTRRIKKLVLTGEERWEISSNLLFVLPFTGIISGYYRSLCDRYVFKDTYNGVYGNDGAFAISNSRIIIHDSKYSTVESFKSYLAAQYAAGTPVTVWYVLAEPETAVVNEPLMKIGEYVDTIDNTQSTVQIPTAAGETTISWAGEGLAPSEVELTYRKPKGQ